MAIEKSRKGIGGRPSKLTPEVQEKIVSAIRAGNYAQVAAGYAGIGERTFYLWMERGRKLENVNVTEFDAEELKYIQFLRAVKDAEHEAEVRAVAMVQKAMPENWTAAMTFLERKFPDRWRRRERVEHSSPDGGAIQVELSPIPLDKLSSETKRRIIEELEANEVIELKPEPKLIKDGSVPTVS